MLNSNVLWHTNKEVVLLQLKKLFYVCFAIINKIIVK